MPLDTPYLQAKLLAVKRARCIATISVLTEQVGDLDRQLLMLESDLTETELSEIKEMIDGQDDSLADAIVPGGSQSSQIHRKKNGMLETPGGRHAVRKDGGEVVFIIVVDGKHYNDLMWLEPWEARELSSLLSVATAEWFPNADVTGGTSGPQSC